jgi:hypothetical protein
MLTGATSMAGPGSFEPKFSVMPSSGWMRIDSTLGRMPSPRLPNSRCGASLKWIAISVTLFGMRLAERK